MRATMFLALAAVGCANKAIDNAEAELLFVALYDVSTEVGADIVQGLDTEAAKELEVVEDGSSATVTGTVMGDGEIFDGIITVNGEGSRNGSDVDFGVGALFDMVYVYDQDVTIDGDTSMELETTFDESSAAYDYDLVGTVDATGAVEGTAGFEITVSASYDDDTGDFSYEVAGDIDGHDVAEYTDLVSGSGNIYDF